MEKEDILENSFSKQPTVNSMKKLKQIVGLSLCLKPLHSQGFVLHLRLQPSPLFKEVYVVGTKEERSCEIEDQYIVEKEGWEEKRRVRILTEELFYNQQYKPFKVLLVDQPMIGGSAAQPANLADVPQIMPNPKEWDRFLNAMNFSLTRKIDQHTEDFKQSYVLVQGFEDDAREKVSKLVEDAIEQLLCANKFYRKMQDNLRQLRDISLIIESYVMAGLFDMICVGLRQLKEAEDYNTYHVLSSCKQHGKGLKDFGAHPEMVGINFSAAAGILSSLDHCWTPLQMLYTLTDCVDRIISTVEDSDTGLMVTTDDLIPIITYVITLSDFEYYESLIYYIENFIFTDISTTKFGFNLTNFRASVMYLKQKFQEFSFDKTSPPPRKASMLHKSRSEGKPVEPEKESTTEDNLISLIANTYVKSAPRLNRTTSPTHFQPPPSVITINENSGDDLQYLKTLSS